MHYTVAALIQENNRYLLIDRVRPPFGWACIAEHVEEEDATLEDTLKRGVKEEMGLEVITAHVIKQKIEQNICKDGTALHHFTVYDTVVSGAPSPKKDEVKAYSWFALKEIEKLTLTPYWTKFFLEEY